MYINKLRLYNYRNIENALIEFSKGVNIIFGDNAQGKTNIIEAIFFSSTGRSHRTRIERELILFGRPYSNIRLNFYKRDSDIQEEIEVSLKRDEKKGIAVNKTPIKRIGELFGELQTVIFSPEDMAIVTDSPSERRRFMDIQICLINKIYYYHLQQYFKVLKQRNSLLKQRDRDSLFVWDSQLVSHGKEVIAIRKWFLEAISPLAEVIHSHLTDGTERLQTEYKPSSAAEDFERKLERALEKDMLYGVTSIGPHKDDIAFQINGQDAKTFGSQGQKRTVVLSLKLAEIEIVKNEIGDEPVLLLDDALSELDSKRQKMLIEYIGNMQTIITATGMEDLVLELKDSARVFNIQQGKILD